MDEDESSDSEVEEYSGMEQPPLLRQLKGILAEYPDDGQIIKELIQNAEDAGATEMKILFDGRSVNRAEDQEVVYQRLYRKFFKGPALCFYNNEVFSEEDWRGIKMIYSSVKEEDPLKVGRFGLGFKSVFHITDYPCIISGDRLLLMNPHAKPEKVCVIIRLADLRRCKRMKISDFLESFEGTFGFTVDALNTGKFGGTIFWFPLRENTSNLSDNTYNKSKIMDLFKSFQTEAVHCLLFLKSLCRVDLHCRSSETSYDLPNGQPFFQVQLEDQGSVIKKERQKFLHEIKNKNGTITETDIVSVTQPTFKTCFCCTDMEDKDESESSWMIVNMLKGGKMSDKLSSLVNDKDLSYVPFVGVAVSITDCSEKSRGHIFCFLPLPQEKKSLTGLPIHVNGFFAMSQNRRFLKWASADQDTFHMHRDKSIEWNECLVSEVLPGTYLRLLDELIARSKQEGNSVQAVEMVYRSVPDILTVNSKWEQLVKYLYRELCRMNCVFIRKQNSWTKPDETLFTIFDRQKISQEVKESVIMALNQYDKIQNTSVPDHIWRFIKSSASPKDISPARLIPVLKMGKEYTQYLQHDDKLNVFAYITAEKNYGLLQDMELLPLEDGSFIKFHKKGPRSVPIFICTKEESLLFPGQECRLVSTNIPEKIASILRHIANKGKYQIETLTVNDVGRLLKDTVKMYFKDKDPVVLVCSSENRKFSIWIKQVWIYLMHYPADKVWAFSDLPLMPHLKTGTWKDQSWEVGEIHLYKLTNVFVLRSDEEPDEITDGVFNALQHLSVIVLSSLPGWIDARRVLSICHLSKSGIRQLFERLEKYGFEGFINFNQNCSPLDREDFVCFLSAYRSCLKGNTKSYIQKLELFQRKQSLRESSAAYAAIAATDRIVNVSPEFPVRFPEHMFVASSESSLQVATLFGAIEMKDSEMITYILQVIQEGGNYTQDEVQIIMTWLLKQYGKLENQENIISLARSISFVQNEAELCKPSEVFDPRDKFLRALFFGENKFPVGNYMSDVCLDVLLSLGMKTRKDISADSLYQTAKLIDNTCKTGEVNKDILQKAKALFVSFEEDASNLLSRVRETGTELYNSIRHFKCFLHKKESPRSYPKNLPWAGTKYFLCSPDQLRSTSAVNIAGSVIPLVKYKSKQFGQLFGWDLQVETKVLIDQFQAIKANYTSDSKAKLLNMIADIYKSMADIALTLTNDEKFQKFIQGDCIWWGDGFCSPRQLLLEKTSNDIDLKPYVYTLPTELESLKSFFANIGCQKMQCWRLLTDVLETIATKHKTDKVSKRHIVRKDLHLILQILVRLFEEKDEVSEVCDKVLFPVHTDDDTKLLLQPSNQCTYCDAQWLKDVNVDESDGELIYYVHEEVPSHICEGLGVRSLTQHLMSDAEGLEEWGQDEPLTRRIHNLLKEGYTDGLSVPKELLQNADDAGATECVFIYDERQNLDARTHLLDENMAECQGPALWAYNNALFSENDMKNITKLSGATKEKDTTKIGKFGLGFCAVYNLTDIPSFVSGKNVVIFDPHMKFLKKSLPGRSPGLRIDLKKMRNLRMMKRLKNQFKPFQDVLGCDLSVSQTASCFQGTLFRFPLRTEHQAETSLIKNLYYSKEEVIKLLKQFAEASGNMLLFTQRLETIKVYHVHDNCKSPSEAKLLFCVSKDMPINTLGKSVLESCSVMKRDNTLGQRSFETIQKCVISVDCSQHIDLIEGIKAKKSLTTWIISWATGTARSLQLSNLTTIKGALPLAGVAVLVDDERNLISPKPLGSIPFGFYNTGHIFCYLPLPEKSHLKFHVNGSFAVTAERRSLRTRTGDDKTAYEADWNDALFEDAVVNAFLHFLVFFQKGNLLESKSLSPEYKFFQLWPLHTEAGPVIPSFNYGFYKYIIEKNVPVFHSSGCWIGFRNCVFLERDLVTDSNVGQLAMSTVQQFITNKESFVVDLPVNYFDEIRRIKGWADGCRILTRDEFFKEIFLPNVNDEYWNDKEKTEERKELLISCLKTSTNAIDNMLKKIECIPTQPDGCLRKPTDLVHPDKSIALLFCVTDKRFPEKRFSTSAVLSRLERLGMMIDKLHPYLLADRAESVAHLQFKGLGLQAHDRCKHLIEYLASCEDLHAGSFKQIKDIAFLPVYAKPPNWPFAWKGDTMTSSVSNTVPAVFSKPSDLYMESCKELVACSKLILDSESLKIKAREMHIFSRLGVQTEENIAFETVVHQLLDIANHRSTTTVEIHGYTEQLISDAIYKYLNAVISDKPQMVNVLRPMLASKPIIHLRQKFIPGDKVVFSIPVDCAPDIHEIGNHNIRKYREFLKTAGVRERFEVEEVIGILQRKKQHFCESVVPDEDRQLICNLLQYLTEIMVQSGLTCDDLDPVLKCDIVAPDVSSVLRPTHVLCFDDCDFVETSEEMKFIHPDISRKVAENLGVFSKRNKHMQNCSVEIPFQQKEELVTRLNGLLKGYPCDIGIMKELVQNADDAGASEIHFIKDYRTLSSAKIFNDTFAELQGPALCVFNDSFFTQQDLIGIQSLGIGSKREDPTKTGQYGVGFNAVYNLTDVPSFLTKGPGIEGGETLCIFDPLRKHVKQWVGTRYIDMHSIRTTYPDVLAGYNEDIFFSENNNQRGTVFRFPLRQTRSKISEQIISTDKLDSIFATFKLELLQMLLFLKSLSKITVSNISSAGMKLEWSVCVSLNEEDTKQRTSLSEKCREVAEEVKTAHASVFEREPYSVSYILHTKDREAKEETWFVVQRIGVGDQKAPETVQQAVTDGQLELLPVGGVAVRLPTVQIKKTVSSDYQRHTCIQNHSNVISSSRAYCFLPLPGNTGLPMHINAHFVLDHEARRTLWEEDKGFRSDWNYFLLASIVALAYIEALTFIKSELFEKDTAYKKTRFSISEKIMEFCSFFPLANQAKGKYWKYLVKEIFCRMHSHEEKLFPVIKKLNVDLQGAKYDVNWNALSQTGHEAPLYFTRRETDLTEMCPLLDILISTGMVISCVSDKLQQSLEDSEIPVTFLDAEVVIQHLKSGSEIADQIPRSISETKLKSVDNVNEVLSFCSNARNFDSQIIGLPLLVTNDGILRCFGSISKVFFATQSKLFPRSASKFLHEKQSVLLKSLGKKTVGSVIAKLHVKEVSNLLSSELNANMFSSQDVIDMASIELPLENEVWVSEIWRFLEKDFEDFKHSEKEQCFESFLKPLQQWCLVPTTNAATSQMLTKVSKLNSIVSIETFASISPLEKALRKLGLPCLNKSLLPEHTFMLLSSCVIHAEKPISLLTGLKHFSTDIARKKMNRDECCAILGYFSDNLQSMKEAPGVQVNWLLESLKSLPLYLTKEGGIISLDNYNRNVLVLPDEIPKDGLEQWANATGTVLMRNEDRLKKLYDFLGFTYTESIDVYLEHILGKWSAMPDLAIIVHLKFIKNSLLGLRGLLNAKGQRMIQYLKETAVIVDKNTRRKASDYLSPHNSIFKVMCKETEFPPASLCTDEWKQFLELIGICHKVTASLFIRFAKEVATEGRSGITKVCAQKSKLLTSHLLCPEFESDICTYREISRIKFIVPHTIDSTYTDVHKQHSDGSSFICFENSVSHRFYKLVWSSMALLPEWADPYRLLTQRKKEGLLQICQEPPVDSVIKHCQNVCHSMKTIFDDEKNKQRSVYDSIELLMEEIYNFLQSKGMSTDNTRNKLSHTPVVYIPELKLFVQACQVIEDMSSEQEITPFVLKAPVRYGKFFRFFSYLGAEKHVSYLHYIKALSMIKNIVTTEQLGEQYLTELGAIRTAIENLFQCLKPAISDSCPRTERKVPEGTVLYLPTRDKYLENASALTVGNSRYYEERLDKGSHLKFLIELKYLHLSFETKSLRWLPESLRPKFLTEIVTEEIDTSERVEVPKTAVVTRLETFIKSQHFIGGVVRLFKHFKTQEEKGLSENDEEKVVDCLQNCKVVQVTGLKTYLLLNNVRIEASAEPKDCFIPQPNKTESTTQLRIYIQTDKSSVKDLVKSIDTYLLILINLITDGKIPGHFIMKLFQFIRDPSRIDIMLDKQRIKHNEMQEYVSFSIFPKPGTYVPVQLHHLLNCEFSDFKPHEYQSVAVELEDAGILDDVEDSYTPVYIYARIERPIPSTGKSLLCQEYEVFIGSKIVIVPAFKIYKFVRPRYADPSASKDLVPTDIIPQAKQDQSLKEVLYSVRHILQEAWKLSEEARRHVIQRLYLKWHPDKNIGKEEFCAKVFRYIKEVISKLENGIPFDDDENQPKQARAYPDFTSSQYFRFFEKMNSRSKSHRAYAQSFYEEDIPGGFGVRANAFKSSFTHREARQQEYPDRGEAERWQRQAKVDLRHASGTFELARGDPPAYNMICDLCHQAAEKALKAAGFAKDANSVDRRSTDLVVLATKLTEDLKRLASMLKEEIGDYSKMRYPDPMLRPQIPSTIYRGDQASRALDLAKQIIDVVSEEYSL